MINFTDHLNTLIASNQPEKALEEIRKALRDFKISHPDEAEDIAQLEQQIILHSARLRDLDNKERNIQLSSSEIDVARSRMYSALLGIISSLGEYPELKTFLAAVPLPKKEAVAPKPKSTPVQAGIPAQRAAPAYSQAASATPAQSQKSNNGMLLGVLGTVAVIAVAVLIFMMTDSDKNAVANNPVIESNVDNSPAPTSGPIENVVEVEDVQDVSEESVWEETKALATVAAIDKFLEVFPDGVHTTEAESLRTVIEEKAKEDEEELWQMAVTANTTDMYNFYLKKTELGTYNQEAEERRDKIEENKSEKNRFAKLQADAEADTLDIIERLAMWKSAGENFTGEHLQLIKSKVKKYEGLQASNASITSEGNFVTCRTVSDSKNPIEPGSDFTGNSVYYWARINAPMSEQLSVKWFNSDGKEIGNRSHSVQTNTGLGYRIYSQMRFQAPGTYEVRLYNSKDVLVARRKFTTSG